jgi:chromosome segregation ATPase
MAGTVAELDDKIGRALEQSGRALDRTAEALSAPAAAGDAPNFTWMREELDARIEATVSAVKDVRAQLSTRMADVTQRGDEVLGRLGELAARQDALQDGLIAVETRMADVAERLRTLGERLSQVAAIAAQDRQQTLLARLHSRLDVLEAGLRRIAPEASWSVPESVARALEPVVPSFLAGWLRNGPR